MKVGRVTDQPIAGGLPDAARGDRLAMLKAMLKRAEWKHRRTWGNQSWTDKDHDRWRRWHDEWLTAIKEEIFECQHPTLLRQSHPKLTRL